MDRFLLENATQYQSLVKAFNRTATPRVAKGASKTTSPDMVICARVRPMLNEEAATGFPCAIFPRTNQPGVVDIHDLYNHPRGRPILKSFNYEVDRLFNSETTTGEIYENVVVDLIPYAWNGGVGTLFTYGQTGSGKTFTVTGLEQLVAESLMDGNLSGERQVYITIIDLAGNSAYDLLNSRQSVSILEDSFGETQLAGAHEHLVQSKNQMLDLIELAASFRRTAPTLKNDASSRSHSICRIRISDAPAPSDGLLYLIDLAGSEAARDIAVHGADRMRETREINISLSVLKDCIRGKVQSDQLASSGATKSKQKKLYIPYRQSALTKVLKHVFDPAGSRACRTVIVACLNPSLADVGPSKNTLRYAEMLRVLIPSTERVQYDLMAPMTWNNEQVRDWIKKNSGSPPISSAILAPTESGAQLLRLSDLEIEYRCLKTPGVTIEQARAFRSKMWQMHIDSQRERDATKPNSTEAMDPGNAPTPSTLTCKISSRDWNPNSTAVPFKDRIRPGMVVSWRPSTTSMPDDLKLAVILSPLQALQKDVKESCENAVSSTASEDRDEYDLGADSSKRYLCGLVLPAPMVEAYELNIWQQTVIHIDMMVNETILEYDAGTRYYYLSV